MKEVLKKLVLENFWLKLLSLVLAVLGWCAIMNSADPNVSVTIKNITVNKENEDAIVGENMIYEVTGGDVISIVVSGPRSVIQGISSADVYAYVDLHEISITEACPIHVGFTNSNYTKNVEIVSKSDEVMTLSLEAMVTDNKQVQVELTGIPTEGYYAQADVIPNIVSVYGSETQIGLIEKFVAKVDISDRSTSFETQASIEAYDKLGNVVDPSKFSVTNKIVDVAVSLYRTKNININIDADVTAEYGFAYESIVHAPTTITIAGPNEVINSITDINIPYSKEGLKETITDSINLSDYIPEGCYLVSDVEFVSITISVVRLDESRKITTAVKSLDIRNLSSNLVIANLESTFDFSIWGAEGKTEEIAVKDLGLYIDMKNIAEPGTYTVDVGLNTEKQVIFSDKVQIRVTVAKLED